MKSLQDDAGRDDLWLGWLDDGIRLTSGQDVPGWAGIDGLGFVDEARQAGQSVDLLSGLAGALSYPRYPFGHVGAYLGCRQVRLPQGGGSSRGILFLLMA